MGRYRNKFYSIFIKLPKNNQYLYELGNGIQRMRLVNVVLLTIGGSCVCIEDTRADLYIDIINTKNKW